MTDRRASDDVCPNETFLSCNDLDDIVLQTLTESILEHSCFKWSLNGDTYTRASGQVKVTINGSRIIVDYQKQAKTNIYGFLSCVLPMDGLSRSIGVIEKIEVPRDISKRVPVVYVKEPVKHFNMYNKLIHV